MKSILIFLILGLFLISFIFYNSIDNKNINNEKDIYYEEYFYGPVPDNYNEECFHKTGKLIEVICYES